eukprot:GHVU01229699.1.p1 GENE.GHVU01229699.1~~GHVU01229699.1.p1  ORF type:complete len:470 (-),score=82.03 GHVU01229699.1:308-1717(-)
MQKHTRAHAYVHMQKHTRAHSHTHTRPATVLLLCPSCFIAQLCSQSFSARDGSAIHYTPMDATPPAQRPQQTASAAGTERRENPFKSVAPEVHEFVRRSYPSSLSSTTTSTAVTAANADCRSPQDAERCLPLPPPTDAEWLKTPVLRGAAGWPAQPLRRPTLEFECLVQAYRGCLQRGEGILFADDACTVRFSRTLKECGALFSLKVDNASQAGPLSQVQLRLDDDKEVLAGAVVSLEPPSGFTGELGVGRSAAYCGELQARGPYEAPPVVTLSFRLWDASLAAVKLRLPLPVSALMRPLRLSAREFAGLWTAPAFQSSEEPVAFEGSIGSAVGAEAFGAIKAALELGGGLAVLGGIEEGPTTQSLEATGLARGHLPRRPEEGRCLTRFAAAGLLPLPKTLRSSAETDAKPASLPCLVRLQLGTPLGALIPEGTGIRIAVRSSSLVLARAVKAALVDLLAPALPPATAS